MEEQTRTVVDELVRRGWMPRQKASFQALRAAIPARYGPVPAHLVDVLVAASGLVSPDEKTWFLSAADYGGTSDAPFGWDAWEQLSLEAAGDDTAWREEVSSFWANHFPFVLSVRDGYAYLAYSLADGHIVLGSEPEFEETIDIASSVDAFVLSLGEASRSAAPGVLSRLMFGGA